MTRLPRSSLIVAVCVLALFAYAAYETQSGSARARLFALTVTLPAIALAAVQVVREVRWPAPKRPPPPESIVTRSALAWIVAFFATVYLVGLLVAIPLYSAAYLRRVAAEPWPRALLYGAVALAFTYAVFVTLLHIPLPGGIIRLPELTP